MNERLCRFKKKKKILAIPIIQISFSLFLAIPPPINQHRLLYSRITIVTLLSESPPPRQISIQDGQFSTHVGGRGTGVHTRVRVHDGET